MNIITGRKIFTIILLILVCSGMIFSQKRVTKKSRPGWIDTPYPGTFVGISDLKESEKEARNQAIKDAKRQIIESLGGVIESEFVDNIVESRGTVNYSSSFTESKVKVISRNIISVKPARIFTEKWKKDMGMFKSKLLYKVYVSVPFSEEEHHKYMEEIISASYKLGTSNFEKAIIYCKNGQLFRGLNLLEEIKTNTQPLTEITGLKPAQLGKVMEIYRKADDKWKAIVNSISLTKYNQNQKAKFGKPLNKNLETHVFWKNGGERFGIPDLDVRYKVIKGDAQINSFDKTDSRGIAKCIVSKVNSACDLAIQADIHFPEECSLDSLSCVYNILADNRAFVQIIEKNFGRNPEVTYLRNKIISKLNENGFTLVDDSGLIFGSETDLKKISPQTINRKLGNNQVDFVILGKISTDQSNKIQDGFHFAWADGVIKLVDISNLEVIGTYTYRGKGAGNSKLNAGTKSIAKTSDVLTERMLKDMGIKIN